MWELTMNNAAHKAHSSQHVPPIKDHFVMEKNQGYLAKRHINYLEPHQAELIRSSIA